MKKSPLVIANWKMNMTVEEGKKFITDLHEKIGDKPCFIAPPFTSLYPLSQSKPSTIVLGAQNLYPEPNGAFTGEISAPMIKEAGGEFVIIGHSERRTLFKETNDFIMQKLQVVLEEKLIPIFCIGESMQDRLDLRTEECLFTQLETLKSLANGYADKMIIAYEPVWAIGSGKAASVDQIKDTHEAIQRILRNFFGKEVATKIPLLYGGSVKSNNAKELIAIPEVDGFLVGSASLNPVEFAGIIHAVHS